MKDKIRHKKSNKFLSHMQNRIQRKAKSDPKFAARLGLRLIQTSTVFTLYVLSKSTKNYFFKLSELNLFANLNKYSEFVRAMNTQVFVSRTYLDKGMEKNGIPNGK